MTGQQVAITQLVGYAMSGAFCYACLHLVMQTKTLIYVNITFALSIVCKIVALVFAAILKNRNWGECYIS